MGNDRTVVRGSYGIAYFDEGLNGYYWSQHERG